MKSINQLSYGFWREGRRLIQTQIIFIQPDAIFAATTRGMERMTLVIILKWIDIQMFDEKDLSSLIFSMAKLGSSIRSRLSPNRYREITSALTRVTVSLCPRTFASENIPYSSSILPEVELLPLDVQ